MKFLFKVSGFSRKVIDSHYQKRSTQVMLYLHRIGARLFATFALVMASLAIQAVSAATAPINPSSGHGYAQYRVDQEPINNKWQQITATLIKDNLRMAFFFDFPSSDDFTYVTHKNKISFSGSKDKDSSNLLFAKPVKSYKPQKNGMLLNWDQVLFNALKPLIHDKNGSQIGEQKFIDIVLNGSPGRRHDSTWWNPIEGRIMHITLITDGFDLFGVVSSFDESSNLHDQEHVHHRIVHSIYILN